MSLFLPARPPFSLASVVNSHGWIQLVPFGADPAGGCTYVARLATGKVTELRLTGAPGGLTVTADAELTATEWQEAGQMVAWMVGLDQDLAPFYAAAQADPKLAGVVERAQGRILRSPTLFEDVIKTILTTNTAWSGTKRMVAALVAHFGPPLPGDPSRHAFPTPAEIAASDVETLRGAVRLGYRAPYVLATARGVAEGRLDLEALRSADLPTPELRKRLLAISGVGPYAAANLLMLLGRYDYIPADSWARMMVSREWHAGQPVGVAEIEAAFARWGQWRGLAYWFWQWADAA